VCLPEGDNLALSKVVIGFISDVVGPVSMPLYCVAIYKTFTEQVAAAGITDLKEFIKGQKVSLVKKCLKTINSELPNIMRKKGCDASNVYDEE